MTEQEYSDYHDLIEYLREQESLTDYIKECH